MRKINDRRLNEIISKTLRTVLRENENGSFNIKNVYHVSSESFDEFKTTHFGYFFFSNKPIQLNGNRHTYVCNLSIHKPFVFTEGTSWSYPLWLFLSDKDGYLISEEQFTKEKYDGYLGCPFEFWKIVYYDDEEYEIDQIPKIVKELNMGYDGVIIKGVQEGDRMDIVDDYVVFNANQIQIVRKV